MGNRPNEAAAPFNEEIERFEVREHLGRGSLGDVVSVRDPSTGRVFAVKSLPSNTSVSSVIPLLLDKRFINSYLLKYYGILYDGKKDRIFMEYCGKGNLEQFVKSQTNDVSEADVLKIFGQIVKGLSVLHDNNVIHCGIKLQNILLKNNCEIKVADFGMLEDAHEAGCSKPSDIFALGSVVYYMVTKRLPFPDGSYSTIKRNDISSGLKNLIYRMIDKHEIIRPTVAELLTHPVLRDTFQSLPPRSAVPPGPALEGRYITTNPNAPASGSVGSASTGAGAGAGAGASASASAGIGDGGFGAPPSVKKLFKKLFDDCFNDPEIVNLRPGLSDPVHWALFLETIIEKFEPSNPSMAFLIRRYPEEFKISFFGGSLDNTPAASADLQIPASIKAKFDLFFNSLKASTRLELIKNSRMFELFVEEFVKELQTDCPEFVSAIKQYPDEFKASLLNAGRDGATGAADGTGIADAAGSNRMSVAEAQEVFRVVTSSAKWPSIRSNLLVAVGSSQSSFLQFAERFAAGIETADPLSAQAIRDHPDEFRAIIFDNSNIAGLGTGGGIGDANVGADTGGGAIGGRQIPPFVQKLFDEIGNRPKIVALRPQLSDPVLFSVFLEELITELQSSSPLAVLLIKSYPEEFKISFFGGSVGNTPAASS